MRNARSCVGARGVAENAALGAGLGGSTNMAWRIAASASAYKIFKRNKTIKLGRKRMGVNNHKRRRNHHQQPLAGTISRKQASRLGIAALYRDVINGIIAIARNGIVP